MSATTLTAQSSITHSAIQNDAPESELNDALHRELSYLTPGFIFSAHDFRHVGKTVSIAKSLAIMASGGEIDSVASGYYAVDVNAVNKKMAPLEIGRAYSRQGDHRISLTGLDAAKMLGMVDGEAMAGKFVQLGFSGPRHQIKMNDGRTVRFTPDFSRSMSIADTTAGNLIHAMEHIGQTGVSVARLTRIIQSASRETIEAMMSLDTSPKWLVDMTHNIVHSW